MTILAAAHEALQLLIVVVNHPETRAALVATIMRSRRAVRDGVS